MFLRISTKSLLMRAARVSMFIFQFHVYVHLFPWSFCGQNVADERASRLIDRDLMKTSLSMLSGLGVDGVAVYEEDFENDFLATTRAFYRAESQVCALFFCVFVVKGSVCLFVEVLVA